MYARKRTTGFTLIELLVVVAIIALLISILLPSLQQAREQGKRALCLANLRGISTGIHAYASEDRAEQPIPIHRGMISNTGQFWVWRTADWFTWGGRDAQQEFIPGVFLRSEGPGEGSPFQGGMYGARHRPLNAYVYGVGNVDESDKDNMPLYRCPSDVGYPQHAEIDDAPPEAQGFPCYDVIGNSYRASKYAYYQGPGQAFGLGPYGHRMSTLEATGRLILLGEPAFFNMIGRDDGQQNPDPVLVTGWHKRLMTDNLVFVDGHARFTLASGRENITDQDTMRKMNADGSVISRGPTWTFDCYPTPGAVIWGNWTSGSTRWPFAGAQHNLCVEPGGGPCDE